MKTYKYLLLIGAVLLFNACRKFLDQPPVGKLIPSTVEEYDQLLDNESISSRNFLDMLAGSIMGHLNDDMELTEGIGKGFYIGKNHSNRELYYAYTFRHPYRNPNQPDYYWNFGYQNILYFNTVINGIQKLKINSPEDKQYAKRVIAQALVSRAWWYLNAAMIYGPVYKPGGNNTAKTIPYRTSSDDNEPMGLPETQDNVMQKLAADLHTALPDMPSQVKWPSRPDRSAALALLAYYHLFTRKYDSVTYYAGLSWTEIVSKKGVDGAIYNYNKITLFDTINPVNSLLNSPDGLIRAVNNREMLFYRLNDYSSGKVLYSNCPGYPSKELLDLYDKDRDQRFRLFYVAAPGFSIQSNGTDYDDGIRIQNFRGAFPSPDLPYGRMVTTSGFTHPEILLMRAEGYARTGQLALAIADLNLLRKYRYKEGTLELVPGTQDEVIAAVLAERRRELAMGGLKRFMDLKRLTLDAGKPWRKLKVVHQVGTTTFEGVIDSKDFTLNISNEVLKFNPAWGIPIDNSIW
jgi:hypothetical protein